jgi:hypothetical protein
LYFNRQQITTPTQQPVDEEVTCTARALLEEGATHEVEEVTLSVLCTICDPIRTSIAPRDDVEV